jgi:hypothetical protein
MSSEEIRSLLGELAAMANEVDRAELEILRKVQERLSKLTDAPSSTTEIRQLHHVIHQAQAALGMITHAESAPAENG